MHILYRFVCCAFSENLVCGDIKLGFMVSKGQLEIDIIGVTGLLKGSENCPPGMFELALILN